MAKRKVFISYDHSEDVHYKRLLEAWDANTDFDFEFDNRSPTVAIDSTDAAVIKTALTKKMTEAEVLLVIVGKLVSTSKWVNWEISRAKEPDVKLKLAAVKLDRSNTTPLGLLNCGTSWAYSFTKEGIVAALKEAKNDY